MVSSDLPEQGLPPNSATGYEQLLDRVVRPRPQVREQDDQLVQPDQPPFTKYKQKKFGDKPRGSHVSAFCCIYRSDNQWLINTIVQSCSNPDMHLDMHDNIMSSHFPRLIHTSRTERTRLPTWTWISVTCYRFDFRTQTCTVHTTKLRFWVRTGSHTQLVSRATRLIAGAPRTPVRVCTIN